MSEKQSNRRETVEFNDLAKHVAKTYKQNRKHFHKNFQTPKMPASVEKLRTNLHNLVHPDPDVSKKSILTMTKEKIKILQDEDRRKEKLVVLRYGQQGNATPKRSRINYNKMDQYDDTESSGGSPQKLPKISNNNNKKLSKSSSEYLNKVKNKLRNVQCSIGNKPNKSNKYTKQNTAYLLNKSNSLPSYIVGDSLGSTEDFGMEFSNSINESLPSAILNANVYGNNISKDEIRLDQSSKITGGTYKQSTRITSSALSPNKDKHDHKTQTAEKIAQLQRKERKKNNNYLPSINQINNTEFPIRYSIGCGLNIENGGSIDHLEKDTSMYSNLLINDNNINPNIFYDHSWVERGMQKNSDEWITSSMISKKSGAHYKRSDKLDMDAINMKIDGILDTRHSSFLHKKARQKHHLVGDN